MADQHSNPEQTCAFDAVFVGARAAPHARAQAATASDLAHDEF
jgi:hypothetical protein